MLPKEKNAEAVKKNAIHTVQTEMEKPNWTYELYENQYQSLVSSLKEDLLEHICSRK